MSRHAEQLLEFDKLKEIVSGFTTCAPGRRAILSLNPRQDVSALNSEFTLIREAVAYLRPGAEMGFGSLADPEPWLAQLAMPASVLSSADLLDVASLMETANGIRQTFKGEAAKYPRLAEKAAAFADFRHLLTAIRRAILPNGEISDDASPQLRRIRTGHRTGARQNPEVARKHSSRPRRAHRRRLHHAAQRSLRHSGPRLAIAAPFPASSTLPAPQAKRYSSSRSKPSISIIASSNFPKKKSQRLRAFSPSSPNKSAPIADPLESAAAGIAHLDSVFARARFAREFDCTMPEFSTGNSLRLEAARNPVLEAHAAPARPQSRPLDARARRLGNSDGHQRTQHRRQNGRA